MKMPLSRSIFAAAIAAVAVGATLPARASTFTVGGSGNTFTIARSGSLSITNRSGTVKDLAGNLLNGSLNQTGLASLSSSHAYTISCDLAGGSASNPTTYTYDSAAIEPIIPNEPEPEPEPDPEPEE